MCRNLLPLVALIFAAGLSSSTASAQTLFNQTFNSSSTLADFFNAATPSTGQFNAITSAANNIATISSGALVFTKNGGNSAGFSRSTDFNPVPSALLLQFDLTISGNTTAQTNSTGLVLQLGSGFSSTTVGVEAVANLHSRIAINWTTINGEWSIRRGGGTGDSTVSANTTGTQTLRFYVNNSGLSINYLGIDSTNYSLANDTYDVWVGTTRAPNLTSVVASSAPDIALTDLKFTYDSGAANAVIAIDNLSVTAIPEPASFTFIAALASATAVAIRRQNHARQRTS